MEKKISGDFYRNFYEGQKEDNQRMRTNPWLRSKAFMITSFFKRSPLRRTGGIFGKPGKIIDVTSF